MHQFNQTKKLNFKPKDLFNMILDVESYPEFLPWCSAAKIISKEESSFVAELKVGFKGFAESYSSLIKSQVEDNKYIIEVEAISGPFKILYNRWEIKGDLEESEVNFDIKFKLKSFILDKMVGGFFESAAQQMMEAFEKRANTIFNGPREKNPL